MNKNIRSYITKVLLIIATIFILPEATLAQDRGAKNVKSNKSGSGKKNLRKRNSYQIRRRTGKKNWKNQDKATRKRMKRAAKNARRRQQGKPMKDNRLS